jgi:hypothetical protein
MTAKWNYFSIQGPRFLRNDFFLENPQALPIFLTANSTHVDENYYRSLVERYWQRKAEVFGENSAPLPLSPPQISHGLTSNLRGRALHTFYQHGKNPNPSLRTQLLTPVNSECVGLPASCKAIWQQQRLAHATVKRSEVLTGSRKNFPSHSARSLLKISRRFYLNILPLPPNQYNKSRLLLYAVSICR